MDLNLSGKITLVCGASRGIGYAIAREMSHEGAVTIICSSNQERIEDAAKKITQETGNEVFPFQVDLSKLDQIENLVQKILSQFSRVDILVNNAGGPPAGFFMDFSEKEWLQTYHLTFLSAITLTRKLIPQMVKQKWGRIINMTSISVKQPIDNLILSNSIRMAIIGWAKTIANQYAQYSITINNIATGYTLTERVSDLAENIAERENISPAEVFARWENTIPLRRLAKPEEIAWMVTFLASEKASYITGTTIPVDGGFSKTMF